LQLFQNETNLNLLPYDGVVNYFGPILSALESKLFFQKLLAETEWANDEAIIFGKHIVTKRKVAWYGEKEFLYHYSGTVKKANVWNPILVQLKKFVEIKTGISFNSCLLNLYHSGDEGVGWHSDDEKSLGLNTIIASLSLGAERKFYLRHKKTKETISLFLEEGSLLLMKGETQSKWQHSVPKMKKVIHPRINLTFRRFI